jgi:hypothetical protein
MVMAPAPSRNVLDQIQAVLAEHGCEGQASLVVPHHPSRRDMRLFGMSADTEEALDAIEGLECVEKISRGRGGKVGLHLTDGCVAHLGERLEAGELDVLAAGDLRAGERTTVDFCDPNATKALHVGHLRNLALGNAIAAVFRTAGATVRTQSQVGDIGRSMGEAMAGYVEFGEDRRRERQDAKGDHLIGHCYSRYVQEVGDAGVEEDLLASDPALARENLQRDDLASDLAERLRQADPEAVALWRTVRDQVMTGQEETLARLGIAFDSLFFESDFVSEIEAVGDELVRRGVAARAPSGAVLYSTGEDSYPCLVLRRPDGHSTQHLRYVALWHGTRSHLEPGTSIEVMGDEWLPLATYGDRLLSSLAPGEATHPTSCVLHGMVTLEGQVVKSSVTAPWLIDDLLEEVIEHPAVAEALDGRVEEAPKLAAAVVLGFCLGSPTGKPLPLSKEELFNPARNPGWAIALAALEAWEAGHDGGPEPSPADRDYRFLVAQSQVHRQLVRRVCAELNLVHLVRFHCHLSRWFLQSKASPRLARVMRTISAAGLSSLGLPLVGGDPQSSRLVATGSVA